MGSGYRITLSLLVLSGAAGGCAQAPVPRAASGAFRPARMDSADVHRLCVSPDSVRAGRIECVLSNQAVPPRVRPVPR